MNAIVKILIAFWTIVIVVLGLKYASETVPSDFFDFLKDKEEIKVKKVETGEINMPFNERKALKIKGYNGCSVNNKYHKSKENIHYSNTCSHGRCTILAEFGEGALIPPAIELYVRVNGKCIAENFMVKENLISVGYFVDLSLTEAQLTHLGIKYNDKITLTRAIKEELTVNHKHYFYDKDLLSDTLSVNDKIIGKVNFIMDRKKSLVKEENKKGFLKEESALDLVYYKCDIKFRKCDITYTSNVVMIDGVYLNADNLYNACKTVKSKAKICSAIKETSSQVTFYKETKEMKEILRNFSNYNFSKKQIEKAKLILLEETSTVLIG